MVSCVPDPDLALLQEMDIFWSGFAVKDCAVFVLYANQFGLYARISGVVPYTGNECQRHIRERAIHGRADAFDKPQFFGKKRLETVESLHTILCSVYIHGSIVVYGKVHVPFV